MGEREAETTRYEPQRLVCGEEGERRVGKGGQNVIIEEAPYSQSVGKLYSVMSTVPAFVPRDREKFIIRQPSIGKKMIMIMKTPGSQMGSSAAAKGGGEARGGGGWESGERSKVQAGSTLESTVPKARSMSREVVTLDEAPRISLRVSSKLLSLAWSSLSTVITALAQTSACPSTTAAFVRTLASSSAPSKPEEGRRAEGLEEAL